MNERRDAEEHLRVIRSLMERATVYRAISAPTAVVGSLLSLITAAFLFVGNVRGSTSFFHLGYPGAARQFMAIWAVVLFATLLANTFFIWRKARQCVFHFRSEARDLLGGSSLDRGRGFDFALLAQ